MSSPTRLPLSEPDITVGPILTHEERVLLVAKSDPLARRESVSLDDFADRAVLGRARVPASDGRAYSRLPVRSPLSANREPQHRRHADEHRHPASKSSNRALVLKHHAHPRVTAVPISDLPPSQTAHRLVHLQRHLDYRDLRRVATTSLPEQLGIARALPSTAVSRTTLSRSTVTMPSRSRFARYSSRSSWNGGRSASLLSMPRLHCRGSSDQRCPYGTGKCGCSSRIGVTRGRESRPRTTGRRSGFHRAAGRGALRPQPPRRGRRRRSCRQ